MTEQHPHQASPDEEDAEPAPAAPVRRRRSPQERKALDYAKQRRNRYGENPEASRKGIRLGKARGKRLERRSVARELLRGEDADAASIPRKRFEKWPDTPLGEVVQDKLAQRALLQEQSVVNEWSRVRRSQRRSGKRR